MELSTKHLQEREKARARRDESERSQAVKLAS